MGVAGKRYSRESGAERWEVWYKMRLERGVGSGLDPTSRTISKGMPSHI